MAKAQNLRFIRYGRGIPFTPALNDERATAENITRRIQMELLPLLEIPPVQSPNLFTDLPKLVSPKSPETADLTWPQQDPISHHDLNLLALDLDNIVNGMMGQEKSQNVPADMAIGGTPTFKEQAPRNAHTKVIPKALPIGHIHLAASHEKLYFEEFYNNFATIIQPFQSFEKDLGSFCPAKDIFLHVASREPFLLSAILSQGARMSFQKHSLKEDEDALCRYLLQCLKLFEPALLKSRDDINIVSDTIEAVLLTILLLVSANASNLDLGWRSHLRGAKELLLKYSSGCGRSLELFRLKILVFCKHWFISFEILAGLSSRRGGTLQKDSEMELILSTSPEELAILREICIVRPDGFNLLIGFHHSCLMPIRELIRLLNRVGNKGAADTMHVIGLLGQFYEQSKTEFVNKSGRLAANAQILEGLLIDFVPLQKSAITISWMDISHQSYVLALIVLLLRKGLHLPVSSLHVQNVNRCLLSHISFLADCHDLSISTRCSMLMLQWPMLIGGLNCVTEEERLVAMRFFRSLANIGTTSSTFALKKLNKVWKKPETGEERDYLDSGSDIDVFTY